MISAPRRGTPVPPSYHRDVVQRGLQDLLSRGFLIEVAAAIAVALALLDFVQSLVGAVVTFATTDVGPHDDALGFTDFFGDQLTLTVRGHPLMLASVVASTLVLAAVLFVVMLVLRRVPQAE